MSEPARAGIPAVLKSSDPSILLEGSGVPRPIPLDHSPFTIGRRADNDLCIPEQHISRAQARIIRQPDGWHIEDTNSSSGTFVNGERITRRKLKPNDKIEFGVGFLPGLRFVATEAVEAHEFITSFSMPAGGLQAEHDRRTAGDPGDLN